MFIRQNQNNQLNVNTKLYSSFSDTCMLTIGAWNQQLSVKFHPCKGTNPDTGLRTYASDNNEIIKTSLTEENTTALLKGIHDYIDPAIENKEKKSYSITISSGENAKTMTISCDPDGVYLTIAINLDSDGKTDSNNILTHKFQKKYGYVGYDPLTGGGEKVVIESDYIDFKKKLESIYDLTPAVAHSIKYNNALSSSFKNFSTSNSQSNSISESYRPPESTSSNIEDVFNLG